MGVPVLKMTAAQWICRRVCFKKNQFVAQDPGEMLRVFGEAYMAFLKDPRHIDHDATDKAILLGCVD